MSLKEFREEYAKDKDLLFEEACNRIIELERELTECRQCLKEAADAVDTQMCRPPEQIAKWRKMNEEETNNERIQQRTV